MLNKLSKWLLVIALAITAPYSFAKITTNTPAVGTITLLLGEVQVTGPQRQGKQRLTAGASIYPGDILVTRASGHAHLRFIDGALMSLRPASRLTIQEYHYDSQTSANNKVAFKLEEGIARSISGKAAQSARENFRMSTPVAAIGVRGTDFIVHTSQDRTRALVTEGGIVLSGLENGCLDNWCGQLELRGGSQQLLELDLLSNHPRLMRSSYNQAITSTALNNEYLALVEVNDLPQRALAQAHNAQLENAQTTAPITLAANQNSNTQEVATLATPEASSEVTSEVTSEASSSSDSAPASSEIAATSPAATEAAPQQTTASPEIAANATQATPELTANSSDQAATSPVKTPDSQLETAAPDLAQNDVAQADIAQNQNEAVQTDIEQTDTSTSDIAQNDVPQTTTTESDIAQNDVPQATTPENDIAQTDTATPEATAPNAAASETPSSDIAQTDITQTDTSDAAASKPAPDKANQDDLIEASDLHLALEGLNSTELVEIPEKSLVWGYLNTNQDTLPDYVKDNAAILELNDTHHDTQVANSAYALYRRNQANEFMDPSLPLLSFTLNNASAWLNWQDFREPMQIGEGALVLDFNRGIFVTQLELSHDNTGKVIFSTLGSTENTGHFSSTSSNKSLQGIVSLDGKEAAYLFKQSLPSFESAIDGITHWGVKQ